MPNTKYDDLLKDIEKEVPLKEFAKTYAKGKVSERALEDALKKAEFNGEKAAFLEALERIVKTPLRKHLNTYKKPRIDKLKKRLVNALIILVITAGICWGAYAFLDSRNSIPWNTYEYSYVLPGKLYLRDISNKAEKIDSFPFGHKLKVLELDKRTSTAKVTEDYDAFFNAKSGHVNSFYLVNEEELLIYRSLLSRGEADNLSIPESWMRKALIGYYKNRNYIGSNFIEDDIERFGKEKDTMSIWDFEGVVSKDNSDGLIFEEKLSTGTYERIYKRAFPFGPKITISADVNRTISQYAAFILRQVLTGSQRLVLFEFDASQNAKLIDEIDLPLDYDDYVLKPIPKGFEDYYPFERYVEDHWGIACRSQDPKESEVLLIYRYSDDDSFSYARKSVRVK
ncbi:MAG: hypothetical protein AAFX55_20740 [Bacteroidota bacterium]